MSWKRLKVRIFESQNKFLRLMLKLRFKSNEKFTLTRIGNTYSGYWFPTEYLNSKGTIWGVGLGYDSSFELEMLEKGYKVLGYEPEISCFEASVKQLQSGNSEIYNFGLWDKSGDFKFTGENFSLVDIFQKGDFHNSRMKIHSLWDEVKEQKLEQQPQPRVLRMNIEGAEREILLKFVDIPLNFDVIIFQAEFLFHLPFKQLRKRFVAFVELWRVLQGLKKLGWNPVGINRHQITLVMDTSNNFEVQRGL